MTDLQHQFIADRSALRSQLHALDLAIEANNYRAVFDHLADIHTVADQVEADYLDLLNSNGHSWADIGRIRGVSRQAAYKRFSRLTKSLK